MEHPWQTILGQAPSKSNSYKIINVAGHAKLGKQGALARYEKAFYIQSGYYRNLMIDGYFELYIRFYFTTEGHDLDNGLKAVLDCLQQCGAIKNDNKCVRIVADKFKDKLNPRIEFRLVEIELSKGSHLPKC
jgi:Holliday junction resolvase RusA-like endonuclease